VLAAVTLCYPPLIYFLLRDYGARALVLPLCLLAVLRMALKREWLWGALLLTIAAATLLTQHSLPAKFYPVAVNVGLLGLFAHSLFKPPSFIERIARSREPDLPAAAVIYTRHVTLIWCIYFALNAAVAAWLALFGSDAAWALYSGGIAYLCAGALFGAEFIVRQWLRRKWRDA
jgi:uncharacterized membrane protein